MLNHQLVEVSTPSSVLASLRQTPYSWRTASRSALPVARGVISWLVRTAGLTRASVLGTAHGVVRAACYGLPWLSIEPEQVFYDLGRHLSKVRAITVSFSKLPNVEMLDITPGLVGLH